jgi:hypothetical protein
LFGVAFFVVAVGAAMLRGYAYVRTHSGAQRDQAIIFMTLVVAACTIAMGEIYPFADYGAIGLWPALAALYQLDGSRRRRIRPRGSPPRPDRLKGVRDAKYTQPRDRSAWPSPLA